jgi:phosphomannomutase
VEALIRGLASTGLDVVDLGAVTTPMLYYVAPRAASTAAQRHQVTGSHNPKDYNGFKMVMAGRAIYGDDIQRLRQRIEPSLRQGQGAHRPMDICAEYSARIVGDCKLARPMKIVVDSATASPARRRRHPARLGCEVIELYSEVDGDFPNHHPDPSKPENLADLIRRCSHRCRAGPGLRRRRRPARRGHRDGQDHLPRPPAHAVGADVLSRVPGGTIIYDVKCSQRLRWWIREAGGVPLMWKTGHSLIKAKLKETGAPLAGEMSGHIFFGERWYGFDDAHVLRGARCWRSCRASPTPARCSTRCPPASTRPS